MKEIHEINYRFNKLLKQFNECEDIELKHKYISCMKELLELFPKCGEFDRCFMKLLNASISMLSDEYILKSEGINSKRNVYEVAIIGKKDVVESIFPNPSEFPFYINQKLMKIVDTPCVIYWNSPHKIDLEVDSKIYSVGYEVLTKANSTRNSIMYYVNPTDEVISEALNSIYSRKNIRSKKK